MSDKHETFLNVEREPTTRIYNEGGGFGLLAGVIIALLLIGFFALFFFRPAESVITTVPNPAIEAPAPSEPAPAPLNPVDPAAPEAPAPASPQ